MQPISELHDQYYSQHPREQRNLVGEKAAIRFFDSNDRQDMSKLRAIVASPGAQQWMEEVAELDDEDLRVWAQEKGGWKKRNAFLFAAVNNADHPSNVNEAVNSSDHPNLAGEVEGFVYFYSGHDERTRVSRMIQQGFLPAAALSARSYEVSMAVAPDAQGKQETSGTMASSLRQALFEVDRLSYRNKIKDTLYRAFKGGSAAEFSQVVKDTQLIQDIQSRDTQRLAPDTYFFAFIDPKNTSSRQAFAAAGYEDVGEMSYDQDEDGTASLDRVYVLKPEKAQQRILQKSYLRLFPHNPKAQYSSEPAPEPSAK